MEKKVPVWTLSFSPDLVHESEEPNKSKISFSIYFSKESRNPQCDRKVTRKLCTFIFGTKTKKTRLSVAEVWSPFPVEDCLQQKVDTWNLFSEYGLSNLKQVMQLKCHWIDGTIQKKRNVAVLSIALQKNKKINFLCGKFLLWKYYCMCWSDSWFEKLVP